LRATTLPDENKDATGGPADLHTPSQIKTGGGGTDKCGEFKKRKSSKKLKNSTVQEQKLRRDRVRGGRRGPCFPVDHVEDPRRQTTRKGGEVGWKKRTP